MKYYVYVPTAEDYPAALKAVKLAKPNAKWLSGSPLDGYTPSLFPVCLFLRNGTLSRSSGIEWEQYAEGHIELDIAPEVGGYIKVSNCAEYRKALDFIKQGAPNAKWPGGDSLHYYTPRLPTTLFIRDDEVTYGFLDCAVHSNLKEIKLDIDLENFNTQPKNYSGCDPDIAAALEQGLTIECEAWNFFGPKVNTKIRDYDHGLGLYKSMENEYGNAVPVPKKQRYLKSVIQCVKWLVENEYEEIENGDWCKCGRVFCCHYFDLAGKAAPEHFTFPELTEMK